VRAALRECRAIFQVTMAERGDKAIRIMGVSGLLLTLGAAVFGTFLVYRHEMNAGLALRMLGWGVIFVPRAMMLNTAVNARLMPRQRRRLMQIAAAGWVLVTCLTTAMSGRWGMFPLVGMLMLGMSMTFAGSMAGVILIVLPSNWPLASRVLLPPAWVEIVARTEGVLAVSLVVVLGAAHCLRRMFPAGGDAHLGRHARQVARMQRMRGGEGWSQCLESGTMTGASVLRFYGAAVRRDCARGPGRADPGKMLLHALGPSAHWSFWIASLAFILVVGIALHVVVEWRGGTSAQSMQGFASGSIGGVVSVILMSTAQLGKAMSRTQGEQALLRLSPLAGDRALLHRRLAGRLLRHALLILALLALTILVSSVLIAGSAGLPRLTGLAGLCCLAGQVALSNVLGDYAGDGGGWTLKRGLLASLLALLQGGIAAGAGWLTGTGFGPWLVVIAVGVSAFQLRRAWLGMLAAAPAFPARRMALS
jgi:hypothetical protein